MASKLAIKPAQCCLRTLKAPTSLRPHVPVQRWQFSLSSQRLFSANAALRTKLYTEEHEWIELSSDKKIATLGISKYAANALGDVVFVELPELDSEVNSEDAISAVESVKSASDILTPVSGKVVEANSALESTPKLLNEDPEGEGWIAKIEITGEVEADTAKLMNAEAYQKFTEDADH